MPITKCFPVSLNLLSPSRREPSPKNSSTAVRAGRTMLLRMTSMATQTRTALLRMHADMHIFHMATHLAVCLLQFLYLPICLSSYLSIYLYVYLSVHVSIHVSTCLSTYLPSNLQSTDVSGYQSNLLAFHAS